MWRIHEDWRSTVARCRRFRRERNLLLDIDRSTTRQRLVALEFLDHLVLVLLEVLVHRVQEILMVVEEAVVQELLVKVDRPMVLVPAAQEKI